MEELQLFKKILSFVKPKFCLSFPPCNNFNSDFRNNYEEIEFIFQITTLSIYCFFYNMVPVILPYQPFSCVHSPVCKELFKCKCLDFDTKFQVLFDPCKVLIGASLETVTDVALSSWKYLMEEHWAFDQLVHVRLCHISLFWLVMQNIISIKFQFHKVSWLFQTI